MKQLNPLGEQKIAQIASRYGLSTNAVISMLQAVVNGGGNMAQFYVNELGGGGQWMKGGMTMVSNLFNYALKNTVNNLCHELSNLIFNEDIFVNEPQGSMLGGFSNSGNWWPLGLGAPSSSGGQNNLRYAFFPPPVARLAIDNNGAISVYNTLGHYISGVSQQQGGGQSLRFSSQYGYVDTINLPLVFGPGTETPYMQTAPVQQAVPFQQAVPYQQPEPIYATPAPENVAPIQPVIPYQQPEPAFIMPVLEKVAANTQTGIGGDIDIFNKIDRLAELFNKGVLSDQEFTSKKAELLERL